MSDQPKDSSTRNATNNLAESRDGNKPKSFARSKKDQISDEEIELLAENIYIRLRDYLYTERERKYGFNDAYLPWSTKIVKSNVFGSGTSLSGTSLDGEDTALYKVDMDYSVSTIQNQLELLTKEVYVIIQFLTKTEKERMGAYAHTFLYDY
ncbi:MAG: hypothetical protein QNJ54_06075 [Prochloraceae cyanobacterium]|nr:hypothetical protein [Prochloraceae cyanobacterium]